MLSDGLGGAVIKVQDTLEKRKVTSSNLAVYISKKSWFLLFTNVTDFYIYIVNK